VTGTIDWAAGRAASLDATTSIPDPTLVFLFVAGIVVGLVLLGRGMAGYRRATRMSGISTSRIASIAMGEVLVSGTAEPIELTLVSPLQSATCLYYRARVTESGSDSDSEVFREERAVGFRVRDPSGAVRIFPSGAGFDVPDRFDEESGRWDGSAPPGLLPRVGSAFGPGQDRESQIAALLTVHDPGRDPWPGSPAPAWTVGGGTISFGSGGGRRHYREARIEPGDVVTIVGRAVPFGDLSDPRAANLLDGSMVTEGDPEVAADLAEARQAGLLAATPEAAWGNAAIEGFGIGRPVRAPQLDAGVTPPPPPDPALARRAREAFDIPPDTLVLASEPGTRLFVSLGPPAAASARQRDGVVVGLLGAVVAIVSAMALALVASRPA
jgi:hypothetical protein